ncbi:MAG: hypothetical protein ACE5EO_03995 [Candidatus Krumholzibacteriia bacterium]
MWHQILIAVISIGALAVGWVAVQALVRRQSPRTDGDGDVLACGTCGAGGMCRCGLGRGEHDAVLDGAANARRTKEEPSTENPYGAPPAISRGTR